VPDANVDRVRLPLGKLFPKTVINGQYDPDQAVVLGLTVAVALWWSPLPASSRLHFDLDLR
jgi:hypothetical protein